MGHIRKVLIRQIKPGSVPKPIEPKHQKILKPAQRPPQAKPKTQQVSPAKPKDKTRAFNFDLLTDNFAQCNNGVNYNIENNFDSARWVITSISVSSINLNRIVERLFARTLENKDQILKYCVYRILTRSKLVQPENWTITTKEGRFGDAIDVVSLNPDIAAEIKITLTQMMECKSDLDRLLFVLSLENFEVPNNIIGCRLETILLDDLFPTLRPTQLLPETILRYNGYFLSSCVCLKAGTKYRILDGFKRLLIAQQNGQTEVNAIVLEE